MQISSLGGSFSKFEKVADPTVCSEIVPGFVGLYRPVQGQGPLLLVTAANPPAGDLVLKVTVNLVGKLITLTKISTSEFACVQLKPAMTWWDVYVEAKHVLLENNPNCATSLKLVVGIQSIKEEYFHKSVRSFFKKKEFNSDLGSLVGSATKPDQDKSSPTKPGSNKSSSSQPARKQSSGAKVKGKPASKDGSTTKVKVVKRPSKK